MTWHYLNPQGEKIESTQEEIQTLLANGTLNRESLGWHEGLADWKPVGELLSGANPAPVAPDAHGTAPSGVAATNPTAGNPPNPFEAPSASLEAAGGSLTTDDAFALGTASRTKRFLNTIIDTIVYFVLITVFFVIVGFLSPDLINNELLVGLLPYLLMFLYFVVLEGAFGWTPGKLVTGCRVVTAEGGKIGWGKALGRSLCRFIPFEAFSFLGAEARGWHDSIPGTYVVNNR